MKKDGLAFIILLAVPVAGSNPFKLNDTKQKLRTSLKDYLAVYESQNPVKLRQMEDVFDPYDSYDAEYYDDYDGGHDDFFGLDDDLSPLCMVSYSFLLDDGINNLETPEPTLVLTDDDIGFEFDFAGDKDAVDAYALGCLRAGGQYVFMDVNFSAACDAPNYLNLLLCIGSLCDQDDINTLGDSVAGNPDIPNCSVSTVVKSTDGASDVEISASDICTDSMTEIFFFGNVYEYFDGAILDEDTGEFTGDLEALGIFSDECESTGGRIVLGTVGLNDGCEGDSFSSVPVCVAEACDNEEAVSYIKFLYEIGVFEESECGDVTVSIAEMESEGDSETDSNTSSKSKKSKSKKATKSTKGIKSAKGDKSTKAPKHAKGEKSKKGHKSGKA